MKKAIFALALVVMAGAVFAGNGKFTLDASPGFWAVQTSFSGKGDMTYWYNLGRAYQWNLACGGSPEAWHFDGQTGAIEILSDFRSRNMEMPRTGIERGVANPTSGSAWLSLHPEKMRFYSSPNPHGQKLLKTEWKAVFEKGMESEKRAFTEAECASAALAVDQAQTDVAIKIKQAMRLLGYRPAGDDAGQETAEIRVNLD